ncbi:MAG: hypothetical protein LBQ27_02660, partial [Clostridiales bacterium]|nr:hypothetical protein [Clostridiales bacterium]
MKKAGFKTGFLLKALVFVLGVIAISLVFTVNDLNGLFDAGKNNAAAIDIGQESTAERTVEVVQKIQAEFKVERDDYSITVVDPI